MRAQDFADRCAAIFLYGLPITLFGVPLLATACSSCEALRGVMSAVFITAILSIPAIGLAGACVGIWCYFKKSYPHFGKQVLVLAVLAVFITLATVATQAYRAMKHKHAALQQAPAAAQGNQDAQCAD